jgi:hypothetical protein
MIKIYKHAKIFCSLLFVLLIISQCPLSSALIGVTPTSSGDKIEQPTIDKCIVGDGAEYLLKKGLTANTVLNLDKDTAIELLLSSGKENMNKSIEQICLDLFGNTTGPIPLPSKHPIKSTDDKAQLIGSEELQSQVEDYISGTSACLIVAIWEYADWEDLPYNHQAYDATFYNAHINGNYNWIQSLTNEDARHEPIWEWLAYLCYYYETVDVYLFGHGLQVTPWNFNGYCSFDSIDASGNHYYDKVFYPNEIYSYYIHPYDFSELRMGFGGFCGSFCFMDAFLYSYGSHVPNPDRAWLGCHLASEDYYNFLMTNFFGYYWYHDGVDSLTARNQANVGALYYYQLEWEHPYTSSILYHFDSTGPIYYRNTCYLTIIALDPWGLQLDNVEIQLDYNTVGYGSAYLPVIRSWHHIDTPTNPVYDPYLGYDVWIQSGVGDYQITSNSYIIIQYN